MKTNKFVELTLKQILNHHLENHCTDCGSKRNKILFEDLPMEMQKEVTSINNHAYYLYCEKCMDYSVVFD